MLRTNRETAARHAMIHEGRLAFRKGVALEACPHPASGPHAEWWRHGWTLESQVVQLGRCGGQLPS